jgi:hypothetical protein
MNILSRAADLARSPGDPRTIQTGPSVRPAADEMARVLGWFSIALGAAELMAPRAITRMLGMEGNEGLVRAFGAREIAAGVTSLSTEKAVGLWSRVGGDLLDIATLLTGYRDDNPKKHNIGLVLAVVAAITLIDLASAKRNAATHARGKAPGRDYSDRTGFPQGLEAARSGAAAQAS